MLLIENRLNFLLGKDGFENLSALESDWLTASLPDFISIPAQHSIGFPCRHPRPAQSRFSGSSDASVRHSLSPSRILKQ
jgi:hypothetical protein